MTARTTALAITKARTPRTAERALDETEEAYVDGRARIAALPTRPELPTRQGP